jgi:hypothetical protein
MVRQVPSTGVDVNPWPVAEMSQTVLSHWRGGQHDPFYLLGHVSIRREWIAEDVPLTSERVGA